MKNGEFEIHSITFEGDVRLTELQLISTDRLLRHDQVTKFSLVLNGVDNEALHAKLSAFCRKNISESLLHKIEFRASHELISSTGNGWRDQQTLKLASIAASRAQWVILLDAKNHFTCRSSVEDFFIDNKAKTNRGSIPPALIGYLKASIEYFGLDAVELSKRAMPTITPYALRPDLVRLLLGYISTQSKTKAEIAFNKNVSLSKATEFFLYYAFLAKLDAIDEYYCHAPRLCETLFTVWPQEPQTATQMLAAVKDGRFSMLGLHRNRLPQLTGEHKTIIRKIWEPLILPDPADYYMSNPAQPIADAQF